MGIEVSAGPGGARVLALPDGRRIAGRESDATRVRAELAEQFEIALEAVDHWRAHGLAPFEVMRAMDRVALVDSGWGVVLEAVIAEQRWMAGRA